MKNEERRTSVVLRWLNNNVLSAWFFGIIFLLLSCGRTYNTQLPADDSDDVSRLKREILIRVNRDLVEEDAQDIEAFAKSQNWDMKVTESGLWYMIYGNGDGEKAVDGKVVTIEYSLSLFNGLVCYSSDEFGPLTFKLGFGNVESGLEEGMLLLRTGDRARFIMPPYLAHGLTGDGDCIPPRVAVVYDVELIGIAD